MAAKFSSKVGRRKFALGSLKNISKDGRGRGVGGEVEGPAEVEASSRCFKGEHRLRAHTAAFGLGNFFRRPRK